MAKLAGQSGALNNGFEMKIINVSDHDSRFRVTRCPHPGTGTAASSRKFVFLINFLWYFGCSLNRASTKRHAT
jgi:hypothetical protein